MSLFINSKVHLPSNCEKCPFNYADMSVGICIAADKTIDTRTYGRKRHPDCPMTELPTSHGRLIDADRFLDWLKEFHPNDVVIMSGVKNARTVIEAEVSD